MTEGLHYNVTCDDNPSGPGRRWLSAAEVAKMFGCSVWTIRRSIRAGRYRVKMLSDRVVRIDRESIPSLRPPSRRSA